MVNKIHIRNPDNFHPETIKEYKSFTELVSEEEADIIVINDFTPIETDKIVACNSTGLDHIKAKEIISLRGEDLSDLTAVAELSLSMMIMITRLFKREEIKGKTLGLIGYGRIGQQFGRMARKMGMETLTYEKGSSNGKLKKLLEESDVVSLHITSDEENRNFVDKQMFKRMKDGAIFLNSARPWLVDNEALKWGLNNKLAGAWYDFNMDFQHPKLITTDHLGGTTKESKKLTEKLIANKVKNYG